MIGFCVWNPDWNGRQLAHRVSSVALVGPLMKNHVKFTSRICRLFSLASTQDSLLSSR